MSNVFFGERHKLLIAKYRNGKGCSFHSQLSFFLGGGFKLRGSLRVYTGISSVFGPVRDISFETSSLVYRYTEYRVTLIR